MNVFPFTEAEKASGHGTVNWSCALLEVSRSAFYEWHRHACSARQAADEELAERIKTIHDDSRGTYGWPRVHAADRSLRDQHLPRKHAPHLPPRRSRRSFAPSPPRGATSRAMWRCHGCGRSRPARYSPPCQTAMTLRPAARIPLARAERPAQESAPGGPHQTDRQVFDGPTMGHRPDCARLTRQPSGPPHSRAGRR